MNSKERLIRDNRRPFQQGEKYYYKPRTVGNFWNNNYVEYETLSVKEHLDKIKPYLRYTKINLQKSDTQKFQLTKTIDFTSFYFFERQ